MSAATALHTEAARQQRLLAALAGGDDAGFEALGLAAYRANAAAVAERALAAACPTVQQLLGDESFSAVARRLWQVAPPARGDLAQWGGALPGLLAEDEALGDEPYLADVARVDLAVHRAEMAADATLDPARLAMLGEADPAGLRLHWRPARGCWPRRIPWPRSGRPTAAMRPTALRRCALPWRQGMASMPWSGARGGVGRWPRCPSPTRRSWPPS